MSLHDNLQLAARPHSFLGMARIMRMGFNAEDLTPLANQLLDRIRSDATDACAMLDLCTVLQLGGQAEEALEFQTAALNLRQFYSLRPIQKNTNIRVLAIFSRGVAMANTPIEFLVEETDVALDILYVDFDLPFPEVIPEHDVAFVAICQSDENMELLAELTEVMNQWPRPYINQPHSIARLDRQTVSSLLSSTTSVASQAIRTTREKLLASTTVSAAGLNQETPHSDWISYPAIIRPANSHAGFGLQRIDNTSHLKSYLSEYRDAEFFVAPFIDYRSADGWYRKYRIAVIDGVPYAAHMAISKHWMVHYLNADMLNNQHNRQEEARFMQDFDADFATRHREEINEITRAIELDYYSIDAGEMPDGRLLVFEVDSGAVVHSMDPVDIFPYKRPQMEKVFAAFREQLYRHAKREVNPLKK